MKQVVPILIAVLLGFTAGYILNSDKKPDNSSSDSTQDDQIAKLQKELKESEARAGKVDATKEEESAKIIEKAIRSEFSLNKPTGELTKADLEEVTSLNLKNKQLTSVKGLEKLTQLTYLLLGSNQLTDTDVKGLLNLTNLDRLDLDSNQITNLKGLEKLTKLEVLWIRNNHDITKAQIAELKKALPKCQIEHTATK